MHVWQEIKRNFKVECNIRECIEIESAWMKILQKQVPIKEKKQTEKKTDYKAAKEEDLLNLSR